ncbi:hypothetical protein [Macrococcus sp. DPC7161]|uniref:hypothetical protein n=1 Tax=Macrococcus sp. DPC7161 TaxID=2507060 RepID=UPI0013E90499|nr:hypothetical protein [Macrococcus sp. DPC7161]
MDLNGMFESAKDKAIEEGTKYFEENKDELLQQGQELLQTKGEELKDKFFGGK